MSLFANDDRFRHEQIDLFEDNEMIFEEGDVCRDLYIVKTGAVRIIKKTSSGPIEIARFSKGDFFGDIGLLQSIPRYASAYAVGPTELLVLAPAGFLLKIRRDPTFAFEMLQQMSLRVKVSNDRLLEIAKTNQVSQEQIQSVMNTLNGKV